MMTDPVRTMARVTLRLVWFGLAGALLLTFLAWVWPTRYRYDHMTVEGDMVIVRIDRLSDDADMLVPDQGWVPVDGSGDGAGDEAEQI